MKNAQARFAKIRKVVERGHHPSIDDVEVLLDFCQGKFQFDQQCIKAQVQNDIWMSVWSRYWDKGSVPLNVLKDIVFGKELGGVSRR